MSNDKSSENPAGMGSRLRRRFREHPYTTILLLVFVVGTLFSLVARLTFMAPTDSKPLTIAVVGPMSGSEEEVGRSLLNGTQLYLDWINRRHLVDGYHFVTRAIDTTKGGVDVDALAGEEGVIGVVGHWQLDAARAAAARYNRARLPAVMPAVWPGVQEGERWVFSSAIESLTESRFLANYVRNVVGEKSVQIIRAKGPGMEELADAFDKTMRRFGTKVLYQWSYDPASATLDADLDAIAAEIKSLRISGSLLLLGGAEGSALAMRSLRAGGVGNRVVGLGSLATNAFLEQVTMAVSGHDLRPDQLTNDLLVTTGLLFDTATETAQEFHTGYVERFSFAPDWIAAASFDAAKAMLQPFDSRELASATLAGGDLRTSIRDALEMTGEAGKSLRGARSTIQFPRSERNSNMVFIGRYDGSSIVSAPVQLLPIVESGVRNYIDEVIAGRVLYVNDRFMYKTNVIYTGIQLLAINNLDLEKNSAELEFLLWFRYREGKLDPLDISFHNALEEIDLSQPEREVVDDGMVYRLFRVKGPFLLNHSPVERPYGSEIVGMSFSHKSLSRNNLLYVTDILGMRLTSDQTLTQLLTEQGVISDQPGSKQQNLFERLLQAWREANDGMDVINRLVQNQVLAPLDGWRLHRAWVSQELHEGSTKGDPAFVGYGKPSPSFSQIDYGVIIKPERIQVRDFMSRELMSYIAIFLFIGALIAWLVDRPGVSRYWLVKAMVLRIITWPLLLLVGGSLLIDYGLSHFSVVVLDSIVTTIDVLWWLIPARIGQIFMREFVWDPIEERTQQKIPNLLRAVVTITLYSLAIFGILAFVFDQKLTSLLATSGLMAMIIGLAIQANIANVFSGIVLNIDRPFAIGDLVRIFDVVGRVVDIDWRSTKVQTRGGEMVSLPNAAVSETQIRNMSRLGRIRVENPIYVDPEFSPDQVVKHLLAALGNCKLVLQGDGPIKPKARYNGFTNLGVQWVAEYTIDFWYPSNKDRFLVLDEVYREVWNEMSRTGIPVRPLTAGRYDAGEVGVIPGEDNDDGLDVGDIAQVVLDEQDGE